MAEEPVQNPCVDKRARTTAQKKIASSLLCEMYPPASDRKIGSMQRDEKGRVLVEVRTSDVPVTAARASELGGEVMDQSERYHVVRAFLPLDLLERLAEMPAVRAIQPKATATTNAR